MNRSTFNIFGTDNNFYDSKIIDYFKRPYIIIRSLGWLFSIIVFGCISSSFRHTGCPFFNISACIFSITIGVLTFLYLTTLLFTDAILWKYFDQNRKKYYLIFDTVLTGVFSFMWFVGFCYMVDSWRNQHLKSSYSVSDTEAAIAFSFFLIFIFVALCIMAVQRFRKSLELDDVMLTDGSFGRGVVAFNEPESYQHADFYSSPFQTDFKETNEIITPAGYQQQS